MSANKNLWMKMVSLNARIRSTGEHESSLIIFVEIYKKNQY